MGEFKQSEFEWHADAAFYRPDKTVIAIPKNVRTPNKPDIKAIDCHMSTEILEQTEYFKAALFKLVMERAAAFMHETKQENMCNEKERFSVVHLEIHMDTNAYVAHDEAFEGKAPQGFVAMKNAFNDQQPKNMLPVLGVRVSQAWSDGCRSQKAINVMNGAMLGCHPPSK